MPHYREHNGNYVEITLYDLTDIQQSCSDHTRLQNVFKDNGVKTLDDLLCLNVYEVARWRNLGKKGLWHIINGLAHFGLHLHGTTSTCEIA